MKSRSACLVAAFVFACGPETPPPTAQPNQPPPIQEEKKKPTRPQLTARETAIVDAFDEVALGCPARTWPNYTWAGVQVMLVDNAEHRAVLWNDQQADVEGSVTIPPYADLSADFREALFTFSTWNGAPTLGISMDLTGQINALFAEYGIPTAGDYAISLAFHEGFHFFGQEDWPATEGQVRDPVYPLAWEPRFLRRSQLEALVDVLTTNAGTGAVAHWQDRLEAEHGAELLSRVWIDRIEGSASYVEMVSMLLTREGCDVSETDLVAAILEDLELFVSFIAEASSESYSLGAVAGAVLRTTGSTGWADRIRDGATPVQALIEGVSAVPEEEDPALRDAVRGAVSAENEWLKPILDPLAGLLAGKHVRVALPGEWMAGSFRMGGGFYLSTVHGAPHVLVNVTASFYSDSGQNLRIESAEVLAESLESCGLGYGMTLVAPTGAVTDNGRGTFDILAPGLNAMDVAGRRVADPDGFEWFCPD